MGDTSEMQRDSNLVPLSHQHQHALALCVQIGKSFAEVHDTPDVHYWELEIVHLHDQELACHFAAEEKLIFPAADRFKELQQLVDELRIEHTLLRRNVENARKRQFRVTDLQVFTAMLSEHIRKEERILFHHLQHSLPEEELVHLGQELNRYFQENRALGAGGTNSSSSQP